MNTQELHDDKVRHLAEDYRRKGYEVVLDPAPASIPGFDPNMRPDLLAKKDRDRIVVEVESRGGLRDSDSVRRMADALARAPEWRFELVVLEDPEIESNQPVGVEFIHAQLDSAELLLKNGQLASAFALAWLSVEAVLRRIALKSNLEIRDASPIRLMRELAFNGLMSRDDYDFLDRQLAMRNRVVHGFDAEGVTAHSIQQLRDLATRLIASCENQTAAA